MTEFAKAERAVNSSQLLLDAGDLGGACNRAYYAMFEAARVALAQSNSPVKAEAIRSHSGLIAAFSLHLVKTGKIPVELGRAFNKVEELRIVADYRDVSITQENAAWAVQQAKEFVEFISKTF